MGVTGARAQTSIAAPDLVHRVRAADSNALVGVGLGVSSGSQAWEVSQYADAVIVGSLLVKCLVDAEDAGRPAELSGLRAVVADLAEGMRRGAPQVQELPVRRAGNRSVSGTEYRGRARWALVVGVILLLVSCTSPQPTVARTDPDPAGFSGGTSLPQPDELPAVTLTDTSGNSYNLATSPSKPVVLLFFGYSHCPDVCVTVLADVAQALNRMEASDRDQIQMIFITTDPARDKPRVIASYLERFDPTFIGLTGDLSAIKAAAGRVASTSKECASCRAAATRSGTPRRSSDSIRHRKGRGAVDPGDPYRRSQRRLQSLAERSR